MKNLTGAVDGSASIRTPFFGLSRVRRRALSIFGVVLGVAVAAVVTAGLITVFGTTTESVEVGQQQTALIAQENAIVAAYASSRQYELDGLQNIAYAATPESLQSNTHGDINTPWGGEVEWNAGPLGAVAAADDDQFTVTITNMPESACLRLASSALSRVGSDVTLVYVGTTAARAAASTTFGPVASIAELQDGTTSATNGECVDGDGNDVGYTVQR